jgi:uncharacterized membrane protein HdeD (DUF308 family)
MSGIREQNYEVRSTRSLAMSSIIVAVAPDKAINELWWTGLVGGVLALFFGITAVFWPGLTLVVLVYLFSGFILAFGVLYLLVGLMSIRRRSSWWVTALVGALAIGGGVYLVRHPAVSFTTFVLIVGLLLIARGLLDLARVFVDRLDGATKTFMAIVGVAGIIAGILILAQPVTGGVAFVWILGLFAIIDGILGIAIALELRTRLFEQEVPGTTTQDSPAEASDTDTAASQDTRGRRKRIRGQTT